MANELTVFKARIVTMEIEGHKLRSVEGTDMVCITDITESIGVGHASLWIKKLNVLSNDHKLNVLSNDIKVEYYDINEANPAAFTNTSGIIEILAGSRKPIAKVILQSLIGKLRERAAVAPVDNSLALAKAIEGLTMIMQSFDMRLKAVELKQGWQELAVTTTTKVNVRRQHRTPHIVLDDMVKAHSFSYFSGDVGYVWHFLTHNYKLDHGRDLYKISKNRDITIQMAAEQEGLLDHLIEYAKELFGRKIIQSEMPF